MAGDCSAGTRTGAARRRTVLVLALAATLAPAPALTGCGPAEPADPSAATSAPDLLADVELVPGMVRARLGTSPTMRRLSILPTTLAVEVRDPDIPENLDLHSYYAGQWHTQPVRVTLAEIERLDDTTFSLADIDFTVAEGLMSMALEGLALEGEQVTSISYDRLEGEAPRVHIAVNGLRGSGSLTAGADGSNPRIRRD